MNKIFREILIELLFFILGVFVIITLFHNNLILTFVLIVTSFLATRVWYKKRDLYIFISAAVIGPIAEIIAINFGVWQYANPTFLGIPLWLPFAWGQFSILIKRVSDTLIKLDNGAKS